MGEICKFFENFVILSLTRGPFPFRCVRGWSLLNVVLLVMLCQTLQLRFISGCGWKNRQSDLSYPSPSPVALWVMNCLPVPMVERAVSTGKTTATKFDHHHNCHNIIHNLNAILGQLFPPNSILPSTRQKPSDH